MRLDHQKTRFYVPKLVLEECESVNRECLQQAHVNKCLFPDEEATFGGSENLAKWALAGRRRSPGFGTVFHLYLCPLSPVQPWWTASPASRSQPCGALWNRVGPSNYGPNSPKLWAKSALSSSCSPWYSVKAAQRWLSVLPKNVAVTFSGYLGGGVRDVVLTIDGKLYS